MKAITTIIMLTLYLAIADKPSARPIRDLSDGNRIIAYVDPGDGMRAVRDNNKRVVGYVDDAKTYDKNRRAVLDYPSPTFVLNR